MSVSGGVEWLPSQAELKEIFLRKFRAPEAAGWAPRRRWKFDYFLPAEVYEATVNRLVRPETAWIDIGGGRDIFPENPKLAQELADRAGVVVGVDPSDNIQQNRFVQERAQCLIEDFQTDRTFDLATMRMVVEHVTEPQRLAQALHRLLKPGGLAVIFTINEWSPVSLVSRLTPFHLHYPIKRLFWGGEESDTFPVQYKLNTRGKLRQCLGAAGLDEVAFAHLDHLAVFGNFRWMNYVELCVWKGFQTMGLTYPENCLLGVYRKAPA